MISILIFLFVASFIPAQGNVCKSDVDCGAGECCYIPSRFLVMSRRKAAVDVVGVPLEPLDFTHQNGTCEKYRTLGETCSGLAKMNGHCGCSPGLYCKFYPLHLMTLPPVLLQPEPAVASRRSMPLGHSQCEPISTA
ncbi:hypothetical protein ACJMK2_033635 [Sinanodonta woodiana]|uniref:Prokineticin domain-containing protein n=1 Tax=Sinanodonta woodiana TaxID=1069815 RepID=A0ABD3WSH9_SINWO